MQKNRNNKGFTLIELLVAIAVIAILAGIILINISNARNKAKEVAIISALGQVRADKELNINGTGIYSVTSEKIKESIENNGGEFIETVGAEESYFAASSIPTGGYYCVDSKGSSGKIANKPANNAIDCEGSPGSIVSTSTPSTLSTPSPVSTTVLNSSNIDMLDETWLPNSAIVFSPRWPRGRNGTISIKPSDHMNIAKQYGATAIGWHYPSVWINRSNEILSLAPKQGIKELQCALPSGTRKVESACINSNINSSDFGNPVSPFPDNPTVFYPDPTKETFRDEVKDFLTFAKKNGCTSFHQDDPWFVYVRQAKGCYYGKPVAEVKKYTFDYYEWLKPEIEKVYGLNKPIMTLNTNWRPKSSYRELDKYFDGVYKEVYENNITSPKDLYDGIQVFLPQKFKLPTITTLASQDILVNKLHIAAVYSLGGKPTIPWDVFIPNNPRFFGNPNDYTPSYNIVKENPSLFDNKGFIDIRIDHSKGSTVGKQYIEGQTDKQDWMIVLRGDTNSRIIHIVDYRPDTSTQSIKISVAKEAIPYKPNKAQVYRPGKVVEEISIQEESNKWSIDVTNIDEWAILNLIP